VKTYPPEMGSAVVNAFLSHLAVEECSCIQQVFEALTTRESDDPEVASIEGCDSPQPMHLGHPEQRSVSQIHRQIAVLPHSARFLGPHWKSYRSVRGIPPEPPGWWSAVATSQGQPCSQHHRLAQDFVADQGMQGCLFCGIHSSVTSTEQPSRSSRSWRRLITPRSECSGERSTSRSPLASTSPTAAAAGQKTCTAIGAGRLSWLERKNQQPAAAVAQGGLAQRWPPGAPLPAQPLGALESPQRAATG